MKCVMNNEDGYIDRVSDDQAERLVASGKYRYTAKQYWKQQRETMKGAQK